MRFSKRWQGCSEEQPGQTKENPVLPDLFTQIYILFMIGLRIDLPKCKDCFVLAFLKSMDASVLVLLNPYWPS